MIVDKNKKSNWILNVLCHSFMYSCRRIYLRKLTQLNCREKMHHRFCHCDMAFVKYFKELWEKFLTLVNIYRTWINIQTKCVESEIWYFYNWFNKLPKNTLIEYKTTSLYLIIIIIKWKTYNYTLLNEKCLKYFLNQNHWSQVSKSKMLLKRYLTRFRKWYEFE